MFFNPLKVKPLEFNPLETAALTYETNNEAYGNFTYKTIRNEYVNDSKKIASSIDAYDIKTDEEALRYSFINQLDVPPQQVPFNIIIYCYDALAEISDAILKDGYQVNKLRNFLYHPNLQNVVFLVSKECTCDQEQQQKCGLITNTIVKHIGKQCQTDDARKKFAEHSHKIKAYCIQDEERRKISENNHFVMISPTEARDVHHAQIWLEEHPEGGFVSKAEKFTNSWGSMAWTSLSRIVKECLTPYKDVWESLNVAKKISSSD